MIKFKQLLKKLNEKILNRSIIGLLVVSLIIGSCFQIFAQPVVAGSVNTVLDPGGVPDYFGSIPNYANSPLPELDAAGNIIPGTGIRKFVDSLPGLGAANANDLGQYLPVGVPDTTTYPGSDYYEIDLVEYSEQLHKDLPPTKLRGYVQVNTTDPTVSKPNYLGPVIVAQKDRPVRIKFTNKLPTGTGGDLFLPVDTTLMGAGMGPNGVDMYTQNRGTLHLHGGITPWISDGTPHQWITPANENTPYPKGVSVQNVPDMPDPGPGAMTFFYTNQQSARLMFYHDHSYGLTRLNVYAGEAAGYLIRDQAEKDMIASGALPADELPLIIQDKTFVPNDAQLAAEDPTWDKAKWGGFGSLWFPHVYMPNQNPYDNSGANPMGRWDYGPWFWPPYTGLQHGPVANPLYGKKAGEPPMNPGVPNVSLVPESFMDTPMVNGTVYPYVTVQPKPYRFRILNASNDRFLNLQLYNAKSNNQMWDANGALVDADAGEVNMVPAVKTLGFPATWPKDGRDSGVPDPAAVGPNMVQIGTEGGFLTAPAELPNQPVDYVYNRRDIVVLNVSSKTLFMGPAERADVVVDFSKYAGKTLILYNDSPAPVPAFDPRYDYYTGDPDQTESGGAPSTLPGYGPNIRTIMQIKVAAAPAPGYKLADVTVTNGGAGYTAPSVSISGGSGTGASATAAGIVDAATLLNAGIGYNTAPTVAVTGGGAATDATAQATLSITGVTVTSPGAGYTSAPTVTITDSAGGIGTGATAVATVDTTSGTVTGIGITNAGAGYTSPVITITGGGATTDATLSITSSVDKITVTNPGAGYTSAPSITVSGGGASTDAVVKATIKITDITLTNAGSDYFTEPTVTITDSASGAGAAATANLGTPLNLLNIALPIAFKASQNPLLVPEDNFAKIQDNSMTFTPTGSTTPLTLNMEPKAIQELFTTDYGRMNATMGVELPFTNVVNQTTIPLGYIDPATEIMNDSVTAMAPKAGDGTQIWKITHNGVDTHAIHFHLFDVQLINRVGWDGAVRGPDPNEKGWKDTVRMNPLEDCIVALRPVAPKMDFGIPDSVRPLDPTMPLGTSMQFTGIDPLTGNPMTVINKLVNYGWEYVWHCHLLGHEENDMMRPMIFMVAHKMPIVSVLSSARLGNPVNLTWTDGTPVSDPTTLGNQANEIGFKVERAVVDTNGTVGTYTQIGSALANQTGYTDNSADLVSMYSYRIVTYNATGSVTSNAVIVEPPPAAPTGLAATLQAGPMINLTWTNNATNATGFMVERSVNGGAFAVVSTPNLVINTGSMSYTDTAVAAGNSYSYQVKATNGVLASTYSNTANVSIPGIPADPTNLTATLTAGITIDLSWTDNATNETGFNIERSTNGGAFSIIGSVGQNTNTGSVSYTDTAVARDNTYDYRVQALNGTIIASAYSNTANVVIPGLPVIPLAPTNLTAVLQSGPDVSLTWTDNSVNEDGFTLERSINGGAFTTVNTIGANNNTGSVNFVNAAVTPGTTISYRVKAFNTAGASANSNTVIVIVPSIPATPSRLVSALLTGAQIRLTWRDNATNETGFEIQRSMNGGVFTTLANPGPRVTTGNVTYTDITAVAGNSYSYKVRALNGVVVSAFSNTASVNIPSVPVAPSGLTATAALATNNRDTVTLKWIDNSNNETRFTIQRATNATFTSGLSTSTVNANITTITQTRMNRRRTYWYRIQAVNTSGASVWSGAVSVLTP